MAKTIPSPRRADTKPNQKAPRKRTKPSGRLTSPKIRKFSKGRWSRAKPNFTNSSGKEPLLRKCLKQYLIKRLWTFLLPPLHPPDTLRESKRAGLPLTKGEKERGGCSAPLGKSCNMT